jgi:hypothetical protein
MADTLKSGITESDQRSRGSTLDNITLPTEIKLRPMNFKVDPKFVKEYKQFALDNDMKLVDLLKKSFDICKQHPELF